MGQENYQSSCTNMHFVCICTICNPLPHVRIASFMVFKLFIGILRTNDIKATMTLVLVVFVLLKQKPSICMR